MQTDTNGCLQRYHDLTIGQSPDCLMKSWEAYSRSLTLYQMSSKIQNILTGDILKDYCNQAVFN